MKPQYEIAKYIPLKIRRQMVAVRYREDDNGRVCKNGKCPMGWLPNVGANVPGSMTIATWVEKHGVRRRPRWFALAELADEFTEAWDAGKIKSLRKALGVPK